MTAQMREGEHKHAQNTERQAGRQACIRASSSLCYVLRYSVSLHHCTQELEPKQPGFVEPSTHS